VAGRRDDRRVLDRLAAVAADVPVVLVDNDSRPAALAAACRGRPGVTALPQAVNRGFAGGANAGLAVRLRDRRRPRGPAERRRPAGAGLHRGAGRRRRADGAAAPVLDAPGTEAFTGGRIDWERGRAGHHPGALDYLTGAALCISRSAWERVGPLDERLFLYYEDVDWCVRAPDRGVPLRLAGGRADMQRAARAAAPRGRRGATTTRAPSALPREQAGRVAARREALRTLRDIARHRRTGAPRR
jgi:GT2 family glycosyltransferase